MSEITKLNQSLIIKKVDNETVNIQLFYISLKISSTRSVFSQEKEPATLSSGTLPKCPYAEVGT